MRDLDGARNSWQELKQCQSLHDLREAVRLDGESSIATAGCRSACWKAFLLFDTLDVSTWPRTLASSRSAYNSLRIHLLRHIENPEESVANSDPLNEDAEASPWVQLRQDEELRGEILQDVVRCMPENYYFRQPDTQRMLLDILFIFCKLNPDVSYRQGMHEILAPILWVIEREAIDLGQSSKAMGEDAIIQCVFDAEHIEHDTFTLFAQVMQNAKNFYEQTTSSGSENPMVKRSRRIFEDMLPQVDEALAKHLKSIDIVPQIFLMRWIRLLFGREFAFDGLLTIWDVIFAEDPTLEIVDHMCLAMLLYIRWQLIDASYNDALTLLLKYPEVDKDFQPQAFSLDALYLRTHLDYHGGSYLVTKYSGRSLSQVGRPSDPPALQRNITTVSGPQAARSGSPARSSAALRQPRNIETTIQSTAKNIYARGEKLGIGKAFRSAVDEVHKRAQEIREAQTPSPPVIRRPGGPRASRGVEVLQNRNKALEQRSQQLGALLEVAVGELWDYQKATAEKNESAESQDGTSALEDLSVAIAKVQFVQVYLNDPSLPLPEEASQSESTAEAKEEATARSGSSEKLSNTDRDVLSVAEDKLRSNSQQELNKVDQAWDRSSPPTSGTEVEVENLADPSTFEDFSQPSTEPNADVPNILIQSENDATESDFSKADLPPSSNTKAPRPRLEQSSFSWMLGEEQKPSSFTPERNRSQGSLFGDDRKS